MKLWISAVKTSAWLLLLPLSEFILLRFLVRSVFELRIGYVGMTDYDFVFPSLIAFFVMIFSMNAEEIVKTSFNKVGLLVNQFLLISFLAANVWYADFRAAFPVFFPIAWYALAIATVLSGITVFISPRAFFAHPKSGLLWPALLVGSSTVLCKNFLTGTWLPATRLTGKMVCGVLSPLISNISCEADWVDPGGGLYQVIYHPLHTISIGIGCGGMEGVYFFIFAATLILMARGDLFGLFRGASFLVIGALAIYLLNTARICLYALAVLVVGHYWGNGPSVAAVSVLFHNSLGWVLYGVFMIFYLHVWSGFLARSAVRIPVTSMGQAPRLSQ